MRTYRILHRTTYRYGATMTDGYSLACLLPRATPWQTVRSSEVRLVPDVPEADVFEDPFGNVLHQFGVHEPHETMEVEAESLVDIETRPDPVDDTPWDDVERTVAAATGDLAMEVGMFRSSSALVALEPLAEPPVDAGSAHEFARVVSAAFAQRRKTLRNSLRALLTPAQLEAAGVDPGERAERLSLSQFAALSRALSYDAQRTP